ncbi:MAG: acyl-CoA/acyl-ACP dehydrogenase [Pseudomonadaceae bacterium]|nr:acyl-CoA/acyl-ACP dehydrogenase [Pseudomonadaceae bacterium]
MKFGLSEEQRMLVDSVNGYLQGAVDIDRLRAASTNRDESSDDVRRALAELGVFALLVPEAHGGVGLGSLDAALIAEQLGGVCAPVPFIGSAVATRVLASSDPELAGDVLAGIADGSRTVGLAIDSYIGGRRDAGIIAAGEVLSGKSLFVFDFDADSYLVATADGATYLLSADAPGVTREPLTTIDGTRRFGELRLENAEATLITSDEAALDAGVRLGRVLLAADALGAAQHMLNEAVAYAKERKQFNRVIGSFQAVKHMCAEMAAELEPCRSMLWYAGHALDALPQEAPVLACQSKSHITEVASFVAKTATEVHGGMGFTDLLGLHYWFKRIGSARQMLGSPEQLRDEAASVQGLI